MPLDMSQSKLNDPFHWFQRAWTLQEVTGNWLPGGLSYPLPGGPTGSALFTESMRRSLEALNPENQSLMATGFHSVCK